MNCQKTVVESALQLLTRTTKRPTLKNLHPELFQNDTQPHDAVVQITGDPSTGKTLLVTELIARCVLPENHNGNGSSAVLVNTDHHFSVFKLMSVMESLIDKSSKVRRTKDILEGALKNVIVMNCYGSEQFKLTFKNLERILLDNVNISLIAIDSITAYYWYDRTNSVMSLNQYSLNILKELRDIVGERNIVIVFTQAENDKILTSDYITYRVRLHKDYEEFVASVNDNDQLKMFKKKYRIEKKFEFFS